MDHLICADRYYATTQAVTEAIELSEQSGEIVHIETRRSFDDIHSELFESCDDFADNGDVSEFWGESEDEEGESRPWRVHLDRA